MIDVAEGKGPAQYGDGGVSEPGLSVDAWSRLLGAGLAIRVTVPA